MKTTLPDRSLIIKDRLDAVVKEILAVGKDKIAMIILFGSYARGDWVRDVYQEGYVTYSYQSDFDLLLLLKKGKYEGWGYKITNLQCSIEKRLDRKFPIEAVIQQHPSVTLVLEPIQRMNEQLEKGHYFFSDIKKEGIVLYDDGEFQLAEAKQLPWSERKEIAKQDYDYWFKKGVGFFIGINAYFERGEYSLSAFSLHQATESFYNCILLVFSGYKPKLHDILELGKQARTHHHELFKIFLYETQEQKDCFTLLREAYIKARYDKHYKISTEQLLYLIERVEKLKTVTEKICLEWIGKEML